ncbi:MAG: DNA polymerase III subunit gamma/tau [Leptothrix sp. (in: b-proteobacteria)]
MSYVVLARKYRPRRFSEMVGQAHVVQALGNALTQQRLHHAYLFTGTRGVGKTTVSRILAKSLNCIGPDGQGGITATPCGVCSACRDIDSGRHVDYVELDAASNRGVDEISQLLDQSVYKPVVGRFKVYMIDEVHMLSTTAFNAMLKTLEEPPDYLKFVLATTDPQKVPVTVLSRCLQFNLRPMASETVFEHLQTVLQAEAVPYEDAALRLLARGARGSMRDALSLTDQAIAYAGGDLNEAAVRQMLGAVDRGHVVRLIEALAASDGAALVRTVDELRAQGLSAAGALEELCHVAQQLAVLQAVPQAANPADPDAPLLQRLVPLLAADELQLLYSIALHGRAELALAPDEYSGLTMVLLRLLAFRPVGFAQAGAQAGARPAAPATGVVTDALVRPVIAARPAAAPPVEPVNLASASPAATPTVVSRELRRSSPGVSMLSVPVSSPPRVAEPAAPALHREPAAVRLAPVAAPALAASPFASVPPTQVPPKQLPAPTRPVTVAAPPASTPPSAAAPWDDEPDWVRDEAEAGGEASRSAVRPDGQDPRESRLEPAAAVGATTVRAEVRAAMASPVTAPGAHAGQPGHAPADGVRAGLSAHQAADPRAEIRSEAPLGDMSAASAPASASLSVDATPDNPLQAHWIAAIGPLFERAAVAGLVRELAWQAECIGFDAEAEGGVCWQLRVERESLRQPSHAERLQTALSAEFGAPHRVVVVAGAVGDSAARRDVATKARAQADAEALIGQDPLVLQCLARFPGARIVPGSIRPNLNSAPSLSTTP